MAPTRAAGSGSRWRRVCAPRATWSMRPPWTAAPTAPGNCALASPWRPRRRRSPSCCFTRTFTTSCWSAHQAVAWCWRRRRSLPANGSPGWSLQMRWPYKMARRSAISSPGRRASTPGSRWDLRRKTWRAACSPVWRRTCGSGRWRVTPCIRSRSTQCRCN